MGNNRRKFPRFKPKGEMFVLHNNFGKVIDISMRGVLFHYSLDDSFKEEELPESGLLFCYSNSFVDEIPFQAVFDGEVSKSASNNSVIRQRRVVFGDLTAAQVNRLEDFILDNALVPYQDDY